MPYPSRLRRVAPAVVVRHVPATPANLPDLVAADAPRGCEITHGSFGPPPGQPIAPHLVAAAGAGAPSERGTARPGSSAWQERLQQPDVYDKVALAAPAFPDKPHVLGKGWGGTVKLVRHRPTGIYAALKKVLPKDIENAEREFALASRVSSPHVVRPFFYARSRAGKAYLLSPLVDGEPLTRSQEGRLVVVRQALLDILRAVKAVHAADMNHIDTRNPANLLITYDGRGKLIDFGIAEVPFSSAAGQLELDHVVRNFAPRLTACGLAPETTESFRAWLTEAGRLRSRKEIEAHPLLAGLR